MIVRQKGAWRFLHISFADPVDPKVVQSAFDKANDWMRYTANCWIVYTNSEPEKWFTRIREVLPEPKTQGFLILEVDVTERHGQLQEWIWEWIHKDR